MKKITLEQQLAISQATMNIFKGRYEALENCATKHESSLASLNVTIRNDFKYENERTRMELDSIGRMLKLINMKLNNMKPKKKKAKKGY